MRKIIAIVSLFLLISACSLIRAPQKEVSDVLGTEGLVLSLPKFPSQLIQGQGLEIPVTLENKGVYKVEKAVLAISGYDDNFVRFRSPPKIEGISLEGRSLFVKEGERTTKVFTIISTDLQGQTEKSQTFEAVACYQYRTDASPVVCINPKLAFGTTVVESGCDFVDAQLSTSQGAPVAVTKVETYYYSDKQEVEFRIYVKNVGNGVVIENTAYAKRCLNPEPLKTEDLNSVGIDAYLSGQKLVCYYGEEQIDKFKIKDSGYSVRCVAPINFDEAGYTTPLSLSLAYGYITLDVFSINLKST